MKFLYLIKKYPFLFSLETALIMCMFFSVNGLIEICSSPRTVRANCTDTICDVRVIDKICFAKFSKFPDVKFNFVDCDNKYTDDVNLTLPCNINYDTPKILCEVENSNRRVGVAYIILSASYFAVFLIIMVLLRDNYVDLTPVYKGDKIIWI